MILFISLLQIYGPNKKKETIPKKKKMEILFGQNLLPKSLDMGKSFVHTFISKRRTSWGTSKATYGA